MELRKNLEYYNRTLNWSSNTYMVCSSGGTSIRCRWNVFAVTHGLQNKTYYLS